MIDVSGFFICNLTILERSNMTAFSLDVKNNSSLKEEAKQWAKAFFWVAVLLIGFMAIAHATDSTGITDLDSKATQFQSGVKSFAKWGGILMIVVGGVVLASGQAQGQTAKLLFGILLGVGCIMGAWSWFSDKFTYGFAF